MSDRRASVPAMASAHSSSSGTSGPTQDILHCLELQQFKEWLEALLGSKLDDFHEEVRALRSETGANGGTGLASTDAAINEVVSLFHNFKSLQREAWTRTTARWTPEASLTSSWSRILSSKATPKHGR